MIIINYFKYRLIKKLNNLIDFIQNMEKENYKEKILIKPEKIQELLDYIAEIKLNHEKKYI